MGELFSQDKIRGLILKYQKDGDELALVELINKNLGLVRHVANKYKNLGIDYDDLMEEGKIGLMRAIQKFDCSRDNAFSTYAVHWIRQCMYRFIEENSRNIKIPVYVSALLIRYKMLKNRLIVKYDREPSKEELAELLGVSLEKIEELEFFLNNETSINRPIDEDGNEMLTVIPDRNTNVFDQVFQQMKKDEVNNILKKADLTKRERDILNYRFGLNDYPVKTLEQIADIFGLTRERIRQIEEKALNKLRSPKYAKLLVAYLDNDLTLNDFVRETFNGKYIYRPKTLEEKAYDDNDDKTFLQELLGNYTEKEIKCMLKSLKQEDLKIISLVVRGNKQVSNSFYGYLLPKIEGILHSIRLEESSTKKLNK